MRVGKLSLEKDKKTVLVKVVYTGKDGKTYNQVLMYNRTDRELTVVRCSPQSSVEGFGLSWD